MSAIWTSLPTAFAFLLLLAGVADDLRSRKVHNQLVIFGFVTGLVIMIYSQGLSGLMLASISLFTGFVAVLPLYRMRVFGGGDVKLFLAASVVLSWQEVLITLLASIVWGAILGVLQVLLKGEGKAFAHNMMAIAQKTRPPESKMHKIPYTIALLFGFLTSLVWVGAA